MIFISFYACSYSPYIQSLKSSLSVSHYSHLAINIRKSCDEIEQWNFVNYTTGSVHLKLSTFSARAYVEFASLIHGKDKEDPLVIFSLDYTCKFAYIHSISI